MARLIRAGTLKNYLLGVLFEQIASGSFRTKALSKPVSSEQYWTSHFLDLHQLELSMISVNMKSTVLLKSLAAFLFAVSIILVSTCCECKEIVKRVGRLKINCKACNCRWTGLIFWVFQFAINNACGSWHFDFLWKFQQMGKFWLGRLCGQWGLWRV